MPPHKLKYTECIKTNIIKSHNYSTEIEKKTIAWAWNVPRAFNSCHLSTGELTFKPPQKKYESCLQLLNLLSANLLTSVTSIMLKVTAGQWSLIVITAVLTAKKTHFMTRVQLCQGYRSTKSTKATDPLKGDSLLFIFKFPVVPGTHLINNRKIKG